MVETKESILTAIKERVQNIVPGAKVFLFGSRAFGVPTEESDWDILILSPEKVTSIVKRSIYDALFPVSVQICAFINTVITDENEWENNPSYYGLYETTNGRMIAA